MRAEQNGASLHALTMDMLRLQSTKQEHMLYHGCLDPVAGIIRISTCRAGHSLMSPTLCLYFKEHLAKQKSGAAGDAAGGMGFAPHIPRRADTE